MYKFTNGLVCFTEEDKENYIKAGMILVDEKKEVYDVKDNKDVVIEQKPKEGNKATGRVPRRTR